MILSIVISVYFGTIPLNSFVVARIRRAPRHRLIEFTQTTWLCAIGVQLRADIPGIERSVIPPPQKSKTATFANPGYLILGSVTFWSSKSFLQVLAGLSFQNFRRMHSRA